MLWNESIQKKCHDTFVSTQVLHVSLVYKNNQQTNLFIVRTSQYKERDSSFV